MGALAATVAVECNLAHHVNWFVCIGIALLVGAALGLLVDAIIRSAVPHRDPASSSWSSPSGWPSSSGGSSCSGPGGWAGPPSWRRHDPPDSHHVVIFPVLFNGNDLLIAIAVPVVLVALGWFLLRTDAGIAVRSVADNADRAPAAHPRPPSVDARVGHRRRPGRPDQHPQRALGASTISAGAGPALIVPGLVAAIIAGMENLPLAFAASVGLGITSGLSEFNMPGSAAPSGTW